VLEFSISLAEELVDEHPSTYRFSSDLQVGPRADRAAAVSN